MMEALWQNAHESRCLTSSITTCYDIQMLHNNGVYLLSSLQEGLTIAKMVIIS